MFLKGMLLFFLPLWYLANALDSYKHPHREYRYDTLVNDIGTYNFAYDTGTKDAHSMRMEYRDVDGIVRGRYGYTDPWGKLRVVEYEAGPDGYRARGDVGPDLYPHSQAPGSGPSESNANPTPLRMAGWDPVQDPVHVKGETEVSRYSQIKGYSPARYVEPTHYHDNHKGRIHQDPKQDVVVLKEVPVSHTKQSHIQEHTPVRFTKYAEVQKPIPASYAKYSEVQRHIPISYAKHAEVQKHVPKSHVKHAEVQKVIPISLPRHVEAPKQMPISHPKHVETPKQMPISHPKHADVHMPIIHGKQPELHKGTPVNHEKHAEVIKQMPISGIKHSDIHKSMPIKHETHTEAHKHAPVRYEKHLDTHRKSEPLTIHNIDVNPDEIRRAAPVVVVRRTSSYTSEALPAVYKKPDHDHVSHDGHTHMREEESAKRQDILAARHANIRQVRYHPGSRDRPATFYFS